MKRILLFSLLILLSGCTKTVYVNTTEYLYPEDSWLMAVPYATPPNRAEFEKAVIEKRVQMFGDAYMRQTSNLGVCNGRLETITNWKTESLSKKH